MTIDSFSPATSAWARGNLPDISTEDPTTTAAAGSEVLAEAPSAPAETPDASSSPQAMELPDGASAWFRDLVAQGAQRFYDFAQNVAQKAGEAGLGQPLSAGPPPVASDASPASGTTGPAASTGAPPTGPATTGCYTSNPAEVPAQSTPLSPAGDVYPAVKNMWPEGGDNAAILIAAQFKAETGSKNCFGYNIGNVKATDLSKPHMYLRNVSENVTEAQYQHMTKDPANASLVTVQKTWTKTGADGQPVTMHAVKLQPPHPAAAFKVYSSPEDAMRSQVERYKKYAAKSPEFKAALERGDADTVARLLKTKFHYYTADENHYARLLTDCQRDVKRDLGQS